MRTTPGYKLKARLLTASCACFLVLLLSAQTLLAQSAVLDTVTARFNSYAKKSLQEKIYLHTDKSMYLPGEIVWFKAYHVGAANNTPIDFSEIVYTEILDKDNKAIFQAKNAIAGGSGNGSFQLPADLASGTYRIRSYTNWMKNFSPGYFFEKPLYIVNTLAKPAVPAELSPGHDIQFFPEGGELVAGLTSKIAYRAIDERGKGIVFSGSVTDENNNTLVTFRPERFGIGSFMFKPEAGKTYRAVISIPGKQAFTTQLPAVRESGYVLAVQELGGNKLKLSLSSKGKGSEQALLLVHTRQETKISEKISLAAGMGSFELDKDRLGDGISHITVFNSAGQPVCERLYFKRPSAELRFRIQPDQEQYGSRKKVTISLEATNEKNEASDVNASVSVYTHDGLLPGLDIVNYLWLKSELKGNVEDPGYYFRNKNAQGDADLDNLMLTHGWRRFVWDDVLGRKAPATEYLPEIQGHIITGSLKDIRSNSPVSDIVSYLSVPGKNFQLYAARSDNSGKLTFYTHDIAGPSELIAQTDFRRDSTYTIELSSPFAGKFSQSPLPAFSLSEGFRESLLGQSVGNQVQNVFLGNKLRTFYPAVTDSGSFYLQPVKSYLLDNFVRFNTMEEVLREYVTEVPVTRQRDEFSLWVAFKRHYNDPYRNVEPLLVYDGVPVFDRGTRMVRYDPKKVKTVEILDKKYYHGPVIFNSIIQFKSYKSNLPDFQLDHRATVQDYEGTQLRREFYAPAYETAEQMADRMPDFRNLLYWSPDISIDSSGKKTISFYTSDKKGKYRVELQGISAAGRVGTGELILEVK
ncbi:hypothetical protein [Daejeonella sp. JGW-45]|uniref:hypothetical protein n=1 Tax=Daejeonella sp. JGW-45 TaxID=3034148 RepID=UPI0023EC08F3|nr:hypothetical protein [Daejeonella sp. JGW-45]